MVPSCTENGRRSMAVEYEEMVTSRKKKRTSRDAVEKWNGESRETQKFNINGCRGSRPLASENQQPPMIHWNPIYICLIYVEYLWRYYIPNKSAYRTTKWYGLSIRRNWITFSNNWANCLSYQLNMIFFWKAYWNKSLLYDNYVLKAMNQVMNIHTVYTDFNNLSRHGVKGKFLRKISWV